MEETRSGSCVTVAVDEADLSSAGVNGCGSTDALNQLPSSQAIICGSLHAPFTSFNEADQYSSAVSGGMRERSPHSRRSLCLLFASHVVHSIVIRTSWCS